MKIYEIELSGTIVIEAESEIEAIRKALDMGCATYNAEVISCYKVEGKNESN